MQDIVFLDVPVFGLEGQHIRQHAGCNVCSAAYRESTELQLTCGCGGLAEMSPRR